MEVPQPKREVVTKEEMIRRHILQQNNRQKNLAWDAHNYSYLDLYEE